MFPPGCKIWCFLTSDSDSSSKTTCIVLFQGKNSSIQVKIPKILCFMFCSVKNRVLKLRFLAFPEGPGGFREVWRAGRKHFHLSWYLIVPERRIGGNESYKPPGAP